MHYAIGNQHRVTCDMCCADSYFGARWKCSECNNYDLCDECYHADMHDLTHEFRRFDLATSEGYANQQMFLLCSTVFTARGSDGSVVFSIIKKSLNMITHEPLHLA